MRVVCPFTRLHPQTADSLDASGRRWEPVWVGRSIWDYWLLLADLWVDGQTFVVVEHDIAVEATTLDELESCPGEWCAAPYEYLGHMAHGLGCTKFTASLLQRLPGLMVEVGRISDSQHPPGHWCLIDAWSYRLLATAGVERCEAHAPVVHLNPLSTHDCGRQ